jgi:hypothetical protein
LSFVFFFEKIKISADSRIQFPDFFGWPTIETNGKTENLSSKQVFGVERARRAGIFLEKT